MRDATEIQNLPADNGSRLAIYDAIYEHARRTGVPEISDGELFERVIGRLRVLVPRELHLVGERAYFDEKINACLEAAIVTASFDDEQRFLALTERAPQVLYPNGEVRDYAAGLEPARERLDWDNARLRDAKFNVRELIPSTGDDPQGDPFQALLVSMREHGFMKQFPVVKYDDGVVVDGLAREKAAEILQLNVEYMKYWSDKDRKAAQRRDTPLNRILIAIHSNADRISISTVDAVYKGVAEVTGRPWDETAADLALTQEWRRSMPVPYTPWFEVKTYSYRKGEEPKIQVTADNRVMVRSLVETAGLTRYKIDTQLGKYVPLEQGRTRYTGGRKADFARAEDLIAGIAAMQRDRRAANRKVDAEWEQIRTWLIQNLGPAQS